MASFGTWDSVKDTVFVDIPAFTSAVVQNILPFFLKPSLESNYHLKVIERIAENSLKNPVDGSV